MYKRKTDSLFSFSDLMEFARETYLLNRTIVSQDIPVIFDTIESKTGLKLVIHRYPTGSEFSTWIVPKQWDVVEASLKDSDGNVVASYEEHPLFVSIYSRSVHKTLTKAELLKHVCYEENQPDAFAYNWRYAMDAKLQLQDWGISVPFNKFQDLDNGPLEINIDVATTDGDLLVGEIVKHGTRDDTVMFLSNYCHPGQVNDSYSGLMLFLKVMGNLLQRKETLFTYKLLIMPETIGSACYLTDNRKDIKKIKGAVFSEMVGWGEKWYIKKTRSGSTYFDYLAEDCARSFEELNTDEFYRLIGNDEHMFNSVQVGIPSLSLQKHPFEEYHTSNDEPSKIDINNLKYAEAVVEHMIDILETDRIYRFVHATPFWMTRFKLYADDQHEPEEFMLRLKIVYEYLDGKRSILEIARELDCRFDEVFNFIDAMYQEGLLEEVGHPLFH